MGTAKKARKKASQEDSGAKSQTRSRSAHNQSQRSVVPFPIYVRISLTVNSELNHMYELRALYLHRANAQVLYSTSSPVVKCARTCSLRVSTHCAVLQQLQRTFTMHLQAIGYLLL